MATKIDKTRRAVLDDVDRARGIAAELFGTADPTPETTQGVFERVFLLGSSDEVVKPGKLTANEKNVVEDLAASLVEVEPRFGKIDDLDERAACAFWIFDVLFAPDYKDETGDKAE